MILSPATNQPVYLWNVPQLSQSFVAPVLTSFKCVTKVNEVKH